MSIDNTEIDIIPYRQDFVGISTVPDFSELGPEQVSAKVLLKCLKSKMGFRLTFWKRKSILKMTMVSYAKVRYSGLGDYVWVVSI